eukprot:CFRG7702T1
MQSLFRKYFDSIDGLVNKLNCNTIDGLDENEKDIKRRQVVFGLNKLPEKSSTSFFQLILQALQDPTLIILIVAGIISLVLGLTMDDDKSTGWIEGASILAAVTIVVMVTAVNDYQKDKQFRQLNDVKDNIEVNVVRNGRTRQINVHDVVVGDVLYLSQGDTICADGIVLQSSDLKMNEAQLTGESDDIKKSVLADVFLYGGTSVMEGYARMLVCGVGRNSQQGIITSLILGKSCKASKVMSVDEFVANERTPLLQHEQDPPSIQVMTSPSEPESDDYDSDSDDDGEDLKGESILQKKLEYLSVQIGYGGVIMATLTVAVLVIRFCVRTYSERGWEREDLSILLGHFITGVTVLVVAVPEGLPLAVTISLAFSVKKMLYDNNLVRHLSACETMGNATAICSDKTGTLTTNRMTVVKGIIAEKKFDNDTRPITKVGLNETAHNILVEGISYNTTAEVYPPAADTEKQEDSDSTVVSTTSAGVSEHVGSKTECALLQLALDMGASYSVVRKSGKQVRLVPFNSARKRMACVIEVNGAIRVHVKGASEVMLRECDKIIGEGGKIIDLTEGEKTRYQNHIEEFAREGLRTLVLGYKDFPKDHGINDWEAIPVEDIEKDLVFVCLVGIQDPIRPEVPDAIAKCKKAGIVVRMVTGDNRTTATTIASQCGILTENKNEIVMDGTEFRSKVLRENGSIDQDALDRIWPNLRVLARSSPADKYTLVLGMIKSKLTSDPEVVAVTGDGTNDAPALKRADVGFAMGIQGTSVAKDASDIILMDDNFNSIVKAVMWGRNVYDSVSKFLQFQLTVNIVAILLAFLGACIINESPITSIQMLWLNLIMDTLASLALATDSPTDDLLTRKPYGRSKAVLSGTMLKFIFGHALYQCAVVFGIIFYGPQLLGFPQAQGGATEPTIHYTMVFNSFVMCQLFNEFNARKIHGELNVFKGVLGNPLFLIIVAAQAIVQVMIVQFGGRVFSCAPLSPQLWGWCVLIGFLELPWNIIVTFLPSLIGDFTGKEHEGHSITDGKAMWIRSIARIQSQQKVVTHMREAMAEHTRKKYRDRVLRMKSRTQKHVRTGVEESHLRRTASF